MSKEEEMESFIEYLRNILPKGNSFLPLYNENMIFNWFKTDDLIVIKSILEYNEISYEIAVEQWENTRLDIKYSFIKSKLRNDKINIILD